MIGQLREKFTLTEMQAERVIDLPLKQLTQPSLNHLKEQLSATEENSREETERKQQVLIAHVRQRVHRLREHRTAPQRASVRIRILGLRWTGRSTLTLAACEQ